MVPTPISYYKFQVGLQKLNIQRSAMVIVIKNVLKNEEIVNVQSYKQMVSVLHLQLKTLDLAINEWVENNPKIREKTWFDVFRLAIWNWAIKERFEGLEKLNREGKNVVT